MNTRHATLVAIDDDCSTVVTHGGEAITFPSGSSRCPLVPIGTEGVVCEHPARFGTLPLFRADSEPYTLMGYADTAARIDLYSVTRSSNITGLGYSPAFRVLVVRFKADSLYEYSDVNPEEWRGLCRAESLGKYLNAIIKPAHPFRRVA